MTATRAQYTEALTLSNSAFEDFTKHLRACPACLPVRLDCPTRDGLYATADRLRRAVDDMVTGWADARRSATAAPDPGGLSAAGPNTDQPGGLKP